MSWCQRPEAFTMPQLWSICYARWSTGDDSFGHTEVPRGSHPAHDEVCSVAARLFLYPLQGLTSVLPKDRSICKRSEMQAGPMSFLVMERQYHLSRILGYVVGVTLSSQVQSISEFCFTCLFSAKHLSGSLLLCCYSSLSCLDNGNQLLNLSHPFQAPPHSLSP